MAIDVHVHAKGGEDGRRILKAMDELGLERIVLMSPPPHWSLASEREEVRGHRAVIDEIAGIIAPDPARMIGFGWIEPTLPDAQDMVDYALGDKGLAGIKMIPHHWYPDDERAQACYRKVESHGKPMLFHSGILWSWGNTSKYCRPAEFEIMMEYPGIRFAVAHMGWPWTDECIAMADKLRSIQPHRGQEPTCYVDITTGAPRVWKVDALRKALACLGDKHLVYGSDSGLPEGADYARQRLREDEEMLREAGASDETVARVLGRNALRWLGIE
jgi:predicted TIM-barrel fold metal-dependent hydrolase